MSPKVQKGKDASTMMAESFDCVTIFYGEIVGFDKIIAECKADEVGGKKLTISSFPLLIIQVLDFINLFHELLDSHTRKYRVTNNKILQKTQQKCKKNKQEKERKDCDGSKCARCTTRRPWRTRS